MEGTNARTPTRGRTGSVNRYPSGDDPTANDATDRRRGRVPGLALPVAGTVFIALLGLLLVAVLPQATLAHTAFSAEDVRLSTNSGRLTSLTVAPAGDIHYDGLEAEPSSIYITVSARLSGTPSWEPVATGSVDGTGLHGTANYSVTEINLLSATSMSSSDFAAADGATASTDVEVRVQVALVGARELLPCAVGEQDGPLLVEDGDVDGECIERRPGEGLRWFHAFPNSEPWMRDVIMGRA
jgi:hypothetical protein